MKNEYSLLVFLEKNIYFLSDQVSGIALWQRPAHSAAQWQKAQEAVSTALKILKANKTLQRDY